MDSGRTIFSQLTEFLPQREFRKCVERYRDTLLLPRDFAPLDGRWRRWIQWGWSCEDAPNARQGSRRK
ncbi:MAG: DUF4372 domain-containing protein [Nitrospiraceae bacterium]|nr:DUF4372 domain-containing protein [Nitrospiraceae bacterium]